ncbi:hypothetical protein SAMN05216334_1218 [Nitrosomonas ureae]|uniref:Uncharacterized protein n=1 Tax=Nitrosomonas ureae TaxID=44577 RepID=A0A1H5WT94_9PROT|nr:hypothetical protein SAMN05216334_1218 [Nitrosomonas ureae]
MFIKNMMLVTPMLAPLITVAPSVFAVDFGDGNSKNPEL